MSCIDVVGKGNDEEDDAGPRSDKQYRSRNSLLVQSKSLNSARVSCGNEEAGTEEEEDEDDDEDKEEEEGEE